MYRYWVRAFDSNGDAAGWSSSKQFEVQPTLIGPTTAMFSSQPTFSWNSIPQAESYEIFLRTSEGDIVISDIDSNEYTHTEDLPAGNIRWWIRAGNSVGNTGWSHVGITSIVDRTSLISPGETLSTNRPTLEWETIGDASYYIVHVQNSASEIVGRFNIVRDNSYTFTRDLPDGEYTFWVKAIDAATDDFGDSAWSFPLSFTVEYVAPPIEVLTSQLTEAVNVIEDDALAPMLSTPISEHEDTSHAKSLMTDQLTSFLDSVFRDMSGDIANEELAALVEFTSFGVHPAEIGAVLTGILAEIDDATARQILVNTYVRLNDDALAQAFVREIPAVLNDQTIAALVLENGTQINNETATTLISDVIDALNASSSGVTDVLTRVRMNSDGRVALMNGLFDEVDDATLISIFRPIAEQSGFQG